MKRTMLSVQPYKGARDFYPEDMRIRNYIFNTWKKVCKSYGFEEYDFPILEPLEIFASKSGEELVNDQIFSFEDRGGRKLAVRPELTPGTVRMLAQRYKELIKPVKWFMIGNNWRFEKPQLGRGREFYQLEANIFGVDDVVADFEIFRLIIDIMLAFGANKNQFTLRFSDRRLVKALLNEYLKLDEDLEIKIRRFMDKRNKMSASEFSGNLSEMGLDVKNIDTIESFLNSDIKNLKDIIPEAVLENNDGYKTVRKLVGLLDGQGYRDFYRFDPSIIRGFDYSDGLVYEVFDNNPNNNRSLFGGERFDKLISIFGDYDLAATGFAMGDYTLLEFLKNWNLLPAFETGIEYLVTLWPEDSEGLFYKKSVEIADKLRSKGKTVFSWIEPNVKIEKQLKFADRKNIKFAVIVGESELADNTVTLKNLIDKSQQTQPFNKIFELN